MKRITAMYATSIVLAVLAALFVFQAGPAAAASPLACGTWKAVPSVNEGDGAELVSVSALATNDVWSVGDFDGSGYRHTLTEHWDGKSWQVVSSPDGQTILNQLTAVVALSTNDVWAVGHYRKDFSSDSTLIEHWDGTQWSIVPSANTSSQINYFNGVAAVSASDIWGVGSHVDLKKNGNIVYHSLVEHWDGTKWSVVASADPGNGGNVLNSVTTVSANDVWAVGNHTTKSGSSVSLIEHWNGSTWAVVSSPKAGTNAQLQGISALSAKDIWAVGLQQNNSGNQTLVEHWNGTQWNIVASPNKKQTYNNLYAVTAIAANNVWAAGNVSTSQGNSKTLLEHWNGTQWSIVPSANPGQFSNTLASITGVLQSQQLWSVGIYQTSSSDVGHTLTETNC